MKKSVIYTALFLGSSLTSLAICSDDGLVSPPMSPRTSYMKGRFPNLFQTVPMETRQMLLEKTLDKIAHSLLIPYHDKTTDRIRFDGFFDRIVALIKNKDPDARVYIAGGMVRSLLSRTYMKLYKGLEKELIAARIENRQARSVEEIVNPVFERLQNMKAKNFLRSLGVSSDFDVLIDFGDITEELKVQIMRDTTAFINSAEHFYGLRKQTTAVKKAVIPFGDVKDYQKQLVVKDDHNAVMQGGSWLDWLAFDLETKTIRSPDKHPDILTRFLDASIRYLPSETGEKASDKQIIRALRPLLEIPFVSYDPESELLLRADLQRLIKAGCIDADASEQVAKMQRNAVAGAAKGRFAKLLSGSSRDRGLRQDIHTLSQIIKGPIPIAAEFLDSKPVELRMGDKGQLRENGYLVDVDTFISKHTQDGVVLHGTPDITNIINMLHNGCLVSNEGQGVAAQGRGFYTTNEPSTAKSYAKEKGLVLPLQIKVSDNLRIVNRDDSKGLELVRQIEKGFPDRDVNEVLFTEFDVDIVISDHVIIQNAAVLKLPKDPQPLIEAQIQIISNEVSQELTIETPFAEFLKKANKWFLHVDPNEGYSLLLKALGGSPSPEGINLMGRYLKEEILKGNAQAADIALTRGLADQQDAALQVVSKELPQHVDLDALRKWYELKRAYGLSAYTLEQLKDSFVEQSDPDKARNTVVYQLATTDHVEVLEFLFNLGARKDFKDSNGCDLLWLAASRNKMEMVKYLQSKGFSVNTTDKDGNPALSAAARWNHIPLMQYLLDQGADLKKRNSKNEAIIVSACMRGSLEAVQFLLQRGLKDDETDQEGNSLLSLASSSENVKLVEFLHQRGLSVNTRSKTGITPAYQAARRGSPDILKYLHENGASLSQANEKGETPLEVAVVNDSLTTTEYLLEHGIDPNIATSNGETLVVTAISLDREYILKELLKHKAVIPDKTKDGQSLEDIIFTKPSSIINMLLIHGWRPPADKIAQLVESAFLSFDRGEIVGQLIKMCASHIVADATLVKKIVENSYLTYCADSVIPALSEVGANLSKDFCGQCFVSNALKAFSSEDVILALLKAGGDLHAEADGYGDLLGFAASQGYNQLIKYLSEHGLKPTLKTALKALNGKNIDTFLALLEELPKIDTESQEYSKLVEKSMSHGDSKVLNALKDKFGLDVHGRTSLGESYMMVAATSGNLEMVKALVNEGVDANVVDEYDNTVLHNMYMINDCERAVMDYLLQNGADINARNKAGKTPLLMWHAITNVEGIEFYVQRGARLHVSDNAGNTVLHMAKKPDMIRYLIEKGCDMNAANKDGLTPIIARVKDYLNAYSSEKEAGCLDAIKLFLSNGADINQRNNSGEPSALECIRSSYIELDKLEKLVELGLDVRATNISGETAFDIAVKEKNTIFIDLLTPLMKKQ